MIFYPIYLTSPFYPHATLFSDLLYFNTVRKGPKHHFLRKWRLTTFLRKKAFGDVALFDLLLLWRWNCCNQKFVSAGLYLHWPPLSYTMGAFCTRAFSLACASLNAHPFQCISVVNKGFSPGRVILCGGVFYKLILWGIFKYFPVNMALFTP